MSKLRRFGLLITVFVALGGVGAQLAAADAPAVNDCTTHLKLTQHYTVKQLQQALSTMSASTKEYTDCSDVIQQALSAELSGRSVGGGSGGSGGSFLPLPLIIALLVIVLVGGGYGVAAVRRRRAEEGLGEGGDEPPPTQVHGP